MLSKATSKQVADADRAVRESAAVAERIARISQYHDLLAPVEPSEGWEAGFKAGQDSSLYGLPQINPYHPIQQLEYYLDWEEGYESGFCAAGGRKLDGAFYGCEPDGDPFAA